MPRPKAKAAPSKVPETFWELYKASLRVALTVALRWRGHLPLDVAQDVARDALLRLCLEYDPSYGTTIQSYVYPRVRAAVVAASQKEVRRENLLRDCWASPAWVDDLPILERVSDLEKAYGRQSVMAARLLADGWSREEVAGILGVSGKTIWRWVSHMAASEGWKSDTHPWLGVDERKL